MVRSRRAAQGRFVGYEDQNPDPRRRAVSCGDFGEHAVALRRQLPPRAGGRGDRRARLARTPADAPTAAPNAGAGTRPPHAEKSALAVSGNSVAVLPFANRSSEKNEFFNDGVQDTILTSLPNIRQMRVVARTWVMACRGTGKIPQLARAHRRPRAGRRRTALGQHCAHHRPADPRHPGRACASAGQFHKELRTASLFALQSVLASTIATALRPALSPSEKKLSKRRPTETLAAYGWVRKARAMDAVCDDRASTLWWLRKQETLLQAAVELDARLAAAWAEGAGNHLRFMQTKTDPLPGCSAKAEAAIERATTLEPDSSDVTRRLAFDHGYGFDDRTRETEERESRLGVASNEAGGEVWKGQMPRSDGRYVEPLAKVPKATRRDALAWRWRGVTLRRRVGGTALPVKRFR